MTVTAVDDTATTSQNTAVNVVVLANDLVDAAPAALALLAGPPTITTAPANGVTVVQVDGSITYTPSAGFMGSDSFTYAIAQPIPVGTLGWPCNQPTDPEIGEPTGSFAELYFCSIYGAAPPYGLNDGVDFTLYVGATAYAATYNAGTDAWDIAPPLPAGATATVQIPGVPYQQSVTFLQKCGCY